MTDTTEKLYRIGCRRSAEWDFLRFDHIADTETLRSYDKYAASAMQRAEGLIAAIRQYRLDLYEHHQALESVESHLELSLERIPSYSSKHVTYTVALRRVYEGGKLKTATEFSKVFEGKERRAAHALFEQMQKERPGVKCVVDILKRSWEK